MFEEIKEQITLIYKVMASEDFADSVATMLWNIYTKCKEKGFTDEQSLQITLAFSKQQTGKQ